MNHNFPSYNELLRYRIQNFTRSFLWFLRNKPKSVIKEKTEAKGQVSEHLTSEKAISPLDIGGGGMAWEAQHRVVGLLGVDHGSWRC